MNNIFPLSIFEVLVDIKELFSDYFVLVKRDGKVFSPEEVRWINDIKANIESYLKTPILVVGEHSLYFAEDFPTESYLMAIDLEEMVAYDGETFDPDAPGL